MRRNKLGCIYVLTCTLTMKEYVGQAGNWKARWKGHCYGMRNGCMFALHRAMRDYGVENFALTIVRRCPLSELNYWEEYYVEKFDTKMPYGFNMTVGGDGVRGLIKTEAHRENSRAAMHRFYAENPDVREEMSRNRTGRKSPMKGKTLSAEWRTNLSLGQTRRFQNPDELVKRRETARNAYEKNPKLREVVSENSRMIWKRPEHVALMRSIRATLWDDPVYRAKCTKRKTSVV